MAFLTPLFLFGLLAAALPVAIHLIRKEKPPRVVFGTLRFLKNTSRKLILFQQIQQWLLLLLRAAVICLLVFAFARPLFDSRISSLVDADPESAVILVDTSMSMQYGDRFERARDEALAILSDLSAGDEVAVVVFANGTVAVRELSGDLEGARAFIENLEAPGFATTRYMPALRMASDMLESSRHEQRSVYLVSDYQASGLGNDDSGWLLAPGVAFYPVDVGEGQTRNLLLTDVRSPEQVIENQAESEILARVRTTGSIHLDNAEVVLRLNGQEQTRVPVDLREISEAVVRLPVTFEQEGAYQGEIVVASDDFAVDNTYRFTIDVIPRIEVLIVNGEPSPNWYEDEAHWFSLAIGNPESPFSVTTVAARDFDANLLEDRDVVVLLNSGSDLSTSQSAGLENFVREGGSLLLAPGDRVNGARFNQQLAAISPGALGDAVLLGSDYQLIADIDARHPILQPLGMDWAVRFQGYWEVEEHADADVLMQFDNGRPAFLEREVGEGKVLLFASSLDTEWSNLPLQGLYLPLVHESLRYLVQPHMKERAYRVGQVIDIADVADEADEVSVTVSGRAIELGGTRVFTASEAGFVAVESNDHIEYYAVNSDPEESNLERMAPSSLQDLVTNPETTPMQSLEVQTSQLVAELEGPQRVWWWILALVMAILLTETRVANRTYR